MRVVGLRLHPTLCGRCSPPPPHLLRARAREEVIKQGNHIIRLLQERLTTIAATGGDPETFLSLPKSREAVREGFSVLDKGHDDDLGGWSGGRGGMKFPQVRAHGKRFSIGLRAADVGRTGTGLPGPKGRL